MVAMRSLFCGVMASLVGGVALAAQPDPAPSPAPASIETPSQRLDDLYARLAKTEAGPAAERYVALIEAERLKSGADTADLLLARALAASASQHEDVGGELLDQVVVLYPDWPEGWTKRGVYRTIAGDLDGAMRDFAQALKLDARELEALGGVGTILLSENRLDQAEAVYKKALALAPSYEPFIEAEKRVQTAIAAHSL